MDSSSPENQSSVSNPYSAPKSAPKPFAKSHLTLAICGGLIATSVGAGLWLYLRAEAQEEFIRREAYSAEYIHRGPPIMEEELSTDPASSPAP